MNRKLVILCTLCLSVILISWAYGLANHPNKAVQTLGVPPSDLTATSDSSALLKDEVVQAKTDFYTITAKIPNEPLDRKQEMSIFVHQLVGERKEDWKVGGKIYSDEQAVQKEFKDRPKMVYTMDITYKKFTSESRGTVSYVFYIGEYTGGANGNETIKTFTFDRSGKEEIESFLDLSGTSTYANDGHRVEPHDVILSKMLADQTKTNPDVFGDQQMVRDGLGLSYLKSDGVTFDAKKCQCNGFLFASNFQNFAITDEGIAFFFNKYAIAPGAAGITEIPLTWNQLTPFMNHQEVSLDELPIGYTLESYKIAKVLDQSCKENRDCKIPGEYAMMSNCPYKAICLQSVCTVVCPAWES